MRDFEREPWKSRKNGVLRRITSAPFSVPGAEIDGNFQSYERNGERCNTWHLERASTCVRADVDDEKFAAAIRFERYDRRERRKRKDLTGGSGRRKSIILGRSTGKILCLRWLILQRAGNLPHAEANVETHFLPSERYASRHDALQSSLIDITR